jgi:hypothetical protein
MNRSFFSILLLLLICVIAVGFYRGWFTLSSPSPDTGSNKVNVNLTVDQGKMQEDAQAVKKEAAELVGRATEKTTGSGDQAKDKVKFIDP